MIREKQKKVLEYIQTHLTKSGYAPSFEQIRRHFKWSSVSTVHFHIKKLREAGYLKEERPGARGVEVVSKETLVRIPLLGYIAAGEPIEAIEHREAIAVPSSKIPKTGNLFALMVQGESMIDDGIDDGDTIIVKQQEYADNGDTVVALLDNESATVKKFYKERGHIRLQPANKHIDPIIVKGNTIAIQGVVIDVVKEEKHKLETREPTKTKTQAKSHQLVHGRNVADVFFGDSLDVVPQLEKKYTTIYLDPPFNTNRDFQYAASGDSFGFMDKWSHGEYEAWLTQLIGVCKTKLTPHGSLFLHISAEQSLIPHTILKNQFKKVEPIFWKKAHGKNTVKNKLGAVVDVIYKASDNNPKFNLQYVPLDEYYFENSYRNKDARGLYALGSIKHDKTRKGHMYRIERNGITYEAPYGWKISKDRLEELLKQDRIHFSRPKPGTTRAMLYKKLYKHEVKGKPLSNLWDDISYITRTEKDIRLYPTQKPVDLLKRIIAVSSDERDWVLDPVAGSGTTGAAALALGRSVTLIDNNKEAIQIIKKRLHV